MKWNNHILNIQLLLRSLTQVSVLLWGTFLFKCSRLTAASRLSSGLSTQERTIWPPLPPLSTWPSFKFGVKCHLLYYAQHDSLAHTDYLSSELNLVNICLYPMLQPLLIQTIFFLASHLALYLLSQIGGFWRARTYICFFLEHSCTFPRALGRISNIISQCSIHSKVIIDLLEICSLWRNKRVEGGRQRGRERFSWKRWFLISCESSFLVNSSPLWSSLFKDGVPITAICINNIC